MIVNLIQVCKRSRRGWVATARRNNCAPAVVALSLAVGCGGANFPRETFADNSRSDDPWLEGPRCAADSHDDPGLRFEVVEAGSGRVVGDGDSVRIHYVAERPNGTVLHDTHRGGQPIEIMIGSTKIICGVEKALVGMRAGEQRRVFVPARLAFGESGKLPDVDPQTDLVFLIDLYLPAEPVLPGGSPPLNPAGRGRGR